MKKRKKDGTNTAKVAGKSVQGTGKSQSTSPSHTHKNGGAVYSPKKAKGPLDNRGKDTDRIKYSKGGGVAKSAKSTPKRTHRGAYA